MKVHLDPMIGEAWNGARGLFKHHKQHAQQSGEPLQCSGPGDGRCPVCSLFAERRAKKLFSRNRLGPQHAFFSQGDLTEMGGTS